MRVLSDPEEMQAVALALRREGRTIGFVPTMGYLHAGHLSLVAESRRRSDVTVASIFVNPLQFGANEDLDRYPRDLPRDTALLTDARTEVLFVPDVQTMDEVGTMSPALQAKLLRVLQEREFERVGASQPMKVDVRVIAATNSDLDRLVREGTFREDLYYRLNVIALRMPPLRERREDIPLLARHFLERFGRESVPPRTDVTVSQDAMRLLMAYFWPGNIRQLENVMERALALSPGRSQIEVSALPPDIQQSAAAAPPWLGVFPDEGVDLNDVVAETERALITRALDRAGGKRHQAARLLGIKRTTLVQKLKRLGLATPSDTDAGHDGGT